MEKLKRTKAILLLTVLVVSLTGVACENPAGADEHTSESEIIEQSMNPDEIIAFFNPQPEPPAKIFRFETMGMPDGDWEGRFLNDHFNGRVVVETLSSVMRGKTLHLVQSWTLHPPDPIQPVQLTLKGIINHASHKIVMNGVTEEEGMTVPAGTNVHLRGEFTADGSGALSIGGELMFNPQPEPPAIR